jgi:hypothetical protein
MKSFFLFITLFLGLTFTSCQKENINPNKDLIEDAGTIDEQISIFGDWLLIDGKMYMVNLETGDSIVYNHFDATKTVSSLNYDGVMFEFERIVDDSTIWTFKQPNGIPGMGQFWLNNDSIQPYGFYVTNSNMSITEYSSVDQQLDGSSRPIKAYIHDYSNQQVNFYVQEAYTTIDGQTWKYFSELTFQKL